MNIFVTDPDPIKSAYNIDVSMRCHKMILESSQMMNLALIRHNAPDSVRPLKTDGSLFMITNRHKNHPCTKWTGESRLNYIWLLDHAAELCNINHTKTGRMHSFARLNYDRLLMGASYIPDGPLTPFVGAFSPRFPYHNEDMELTRKYQLYLRWKWCHDKREPKFVKIPHFIDYDEVIDTWRMNKAGRERLDL